MKIFTLPLVYGRNVLLLLLLMALALSFGFTQVAAQDGGKVQVLGGRIEPRSIHYYTLPDLKQGQTVYLYVAGTSGNFDPFAGLFGPEVDSVTLENDFIGELERAVAGGADPLVVSAQLADKYFLTWDDDSGAGYDAALKYTIPADGDYQLALVSSLQQYTFGDYRLTVGLDAPQVLSGKAEPTGDVIALFDPKASHVGAAVQKITGALTVDKPQTVFFLNDIRAGDTLTLFTEALSGTLKPVIYLRDYGGKVLRASNFAGTSAAAGAEYTFDSDARGYSIKLEACCEDARTAGSYRLLVGINAPEVLTGEAEPAGAAIIKEPIEVQVGVNLEQITDVDQKSENFGVVADVRMRWQDPALAFSPADCQCAFKTFSANSIAQFLADTGGSFPEFILFNQQGKRFTQNQYIVVNPDGSAEYFERFSTTLQAPDFDLRKFPFDTQNFYIRVQSLYPEHFYRYSGPGEFSRLGQQLGEEEWYVTDTVTEISSVDTGNRRENSQFAFKFTVARHLSYYIFRIIVPILFITIVSWFTFFLKDYGKRIDVTSGNLLLFIAFNFTISGDLPRLGYLTFMDMMLIVTFVISALTIIFNVYLKRVEVNNKDSIILKIDTYMLWLYPLAYAIGFGLVTWTFLLEKPLSAIVEVVR